jgi:hypothetical protein
MYKRTVSRWTPVAPISRGSVWMNLDGRLYPPDCGVDKPGIAGLLGDSRYLRSGFSWTYPAWKLGTAVDILNLVVISKDGATAYQGSPLRFRVVRPSQN